MTGTYGKQARSILLLHGAWAGAWVWDDTADQLRAAGYTVSAPDLIGCGQDKTDRADVTFELALTRLLEEFDNLPAPAMVVGHSGGGLFASAVAQSRATDIASVVYVAGFMLPQGWHYSDICEAVENDPEVSITQEKIIGIAPYLSDTPDGIANVVDPKAARDSFFHDCAPTDALRASQQLGPYPHSLRLSVPLPFTTELACLPRTYIECLEDRSIALEAQRKMQDLTPGATRLSLSTGHAPMLADPVAFTDALLSCASIV